MRSPSPFRETKDGNTLLLDWDNRRIRKDGFTGVFLAVFWIIWAPTTVFVTSLLLMGEGPLWFFLIWLIFGWIGTLAIPYTLLGRTWREWIAVSDEAVCHGFEGFLAPKSKRFPLTTVLCIFFGHCGDETPITLSVFCVPGRLGLANRHLLGYWLAPNLKRELFEKIETFVRELELPLQMNKGYRDR